MEHKTTYPLSIHPSVFVGRKPTAILFGNERIPVTTWRGVYKVILQRCVQDPVYHKRLMSLRGRASGKVRQFVSDIPDGMTCPAEICEGLYGECHYGSQTLVHILTIRILKPIGYDYSGIHVELKQ